MTTQTEIRVSTTARPASNFVPWCMMIGGILLMPFTEGISFGATLLGGFMMRSPDPAQPTATVSDTELIADGLTGKQGCLGFVAGCGSVLAILFGFGLFALLVVAAAGGGQ